MDLVTVREIYRNRELYLDKQVSVGGWVRSIRDSKAFGFIVLGDGSYFEPLQIVYHDTMENFDDISRLNVGAAVIVTGTLVATPQAKQPFEIQAARVMVEGPSAPDYPLQKKRHSFEYLRTISHLRPRTNTFQAVFRVRSLIAYAIHQYFQERDFVYVHTPLITSSDCEGAGEMFQVTTMDLDNVPKAGWLCRFLPGLFRETHQPDRKRTAQRRDLRHGLPQHLHLRPHLPCGELQHHPPRGRVLDD